MNQVKTEVIPGVITKEKFILLRDAI